MAFLRIIVWFNSFSPHDFPPKSLNIFYVDLIGTQKIKMCYFLFSELKKAAGDSKWCPICSAIGHHLPFGVQLFPFSGKSRLVTPLLSNCRSPRRARIQRYPSPPRTGRPGFQARSAGLPKRKRDVFAPVRLKLWTW